MMASRRWRVRVAVGILGVVAAVGLVALGRASVDVDGARSAGNSKGYAAGYAAGYTAGMTDGQAVGLQNGRGLQAPLALPPGSQDAAKAAFNAGYVAGANDAFAGFDGGWEAGAPYLVVVSQPDGSILYRFASRTPMQEGIDYYLCPHTRTICQQPHH